INGLQFYDWHYEHHQPLAGTVDKPDTIWKDIANRPIYFNTVQNYITAAHKHGMKAMFYNLVYGALKDAGSAVDDKWYMYIDKNHGTKEKFALPSNFVSDIFFTDPANTDWQKFITKENAKVYEVFPFDGYHMDQVGNRDKKLYDYTGREIALDETFGQFVSGIKALEPKRPVVMNAVNQYGGQGIGKSPVEFMYTEVWPPNDDFTALARNITDNDEWSGYKKATILAAYMNYDNAENKGWVNTPSILLADAVIFAFGGAHLELGEHMLCKEYFPNNNLQMKEDLKASLVTYYDFLVAYENLLRGGKLFTPDVASLNSNVKLNAWPAQQGGISVTGRKVGNKDVLHFINFSNAAHMNWRDNKGTQTEPVAINNISLHINASGKAKKVWVASPDNNGAAPQELKFRQDNN
ncbi:MAG: cycloisomaltooligosaccharide glucanotransferase, partial [Sphingobacteriales bacterium]